ncbi:hypothetical protein Acr_00g0009710 [Actinidia rufa]|uniref:Uncharacterized protein n=1 Tax=Actinidia rufa TaxID=165716 RepID=A0A7J0D8Z6_9ERIC|nr:hypothetical protein Acr_00g0009710 [Actinidia rufa]
MADEVKQLPSSPPKDSYEHEENPAIDNRPPPKKEVMLGSRAFCKYFALDRRKMVSSGGDNAKDKLTDAAALFAGNEELERQVADLGVREQKATKELQKTKEDQDTTMAKLEKEIVKLKAKEILAKKSAIKERLHPELDIQDMEIDDELAREEDKDEDEKEEEKEEEEGNQDNNPIPH